MQMNEESIAALPTRQRAALINSLTGFKSPNLAKWLVMPWCAVV